MLSSDQKWRRRRTWRVWKGDDEEEKSGLNGSCCGSAVVAKKLWKVPLKQVQIIGGFSKRIWKKWWEKMDECEMIVWSDRASSEEDEEEEEEGVQSQVVRIKKGEEYKFRRRKSRLENVVKNSFCFFFASSSSAGSRSSLSLLLFFLSSLLVLSGRTVSQGTIVNYYKN